MFPKLTTKPSLPSKKRSVISQAMQKSSLSGVALLLSSIAIVSPLIANEFDYNVRETKPFNQGFVKEIATNFSDKKTFINKYRNEYKSAYNFWESKQRNVNILIKNIDNEPNADLLKKAFDMNWAYYYWREYIKGFMRFPKRDDKFFNDLRWEAFKKLCTADMKENDILKIGVTYYFTYKRQQEWHNHLKKYNIFSDDICVYPDWR